MNTSRKKNTIENIDSQNSIKTISSKTDVEFGLKDLLLSEIRSMYYIEKALLKTFPKMIKNACSFELIEAITFHQDIAKLQIARLEEIFLHLNEKPILERCKALEFIISELEEVVEKTKFGTVRDAGIVLKLHKIATFEVATYSLLTIFAENLNQNIIFDLLFKSLNEEKVIEMRLIKIANAIRFHSTETLI